MDEVDSVAHVLKDWLERHVKLARVDARHVPAIHQRKLINIIIIIIKDIYIAPFRHAPKALCKQKVKC